jgi:ribulose-5-phosphate 4-epimerase/fuculose-1-phosphate aldolase
VDKEVMLITAANSWMANISKEQVVLCRIADGAALNGGRASIEIGIHSRILRLRPDVNVVLHFQSPNATALACSRLEIKDLFVIPEVPYYIGQVAVIPYLSPGSNELAKAVSTAMKECNLAVLRNHGQVIVGRDFDEVIQGAIFFEFASGILLRTGREVQTIPKEEVFGVLYRDHRINESCI